MPKSKKTTSKAPGASTPGKQSTGKPTAATGGSTSSSTTSTTADASIPALNIKADIRTALISLLESDDEHMAGIISAISVVIVEKLAENSVFAQKVAECLLQSGFNETVKQDVYEACNMNLKKSEDETEAIKQRMSLLDESHARLTTELDTLEQYSRRNCLVLHGVPSDVNAERAVLDLCNTKLGIAIGPDCIDRTHRLGAPDSSAHNEGARPQPIIVKFTSYRARQDVFMAKRRLKGTKVVITENLTKRRIELLNRAKGLRNVNAAWTSDGRIICLLGNGRKISINSEQDLRNIGRYE